jgi:hypothetical protein
MLKRYIFPYNIVGLLLVLLLLSASVHAKEPEGLVLYYTFDTEEDDVITDRSGTGNNAKIEGNPEWVAGVKGKALDFKMEGDELTVPDSDSLKSEEITIALWVNWTGAELPAKPIQKYTYQQGGYVFKMENEETNMWIYDEFAQAHMYRAIPLPVPGEWTHLAVTFDGKNQKGYVNGVKAEASGNVDMPWEGPIGHMDVPLIIGAHSGNVYTGMIDEVAIYNRALSEDEILITMEEGHAAAAVRSPGKLAVRWADIKVYPDR